MDKCRLLVWIVVTWTAWALLYAQDTRFFERTEVGSQRINTLCQDSAGFLWIATEDGLRKFDGVHFKAYFHDDKDSTSLADNDVHTLFIDNKQRLWVGTANGVQYYLPEEDAFRSVPIYRANGLNGFIMDIFQRKNGDIVFVPSGMGLHWVDERTHLAYAVECYSAYRRTLLAYYEDREGNAWLIKDREGLVRVLPDGHTEKNYFSHSTVVGVVEDTDGRLLVASTDSVYVWDRSHDRFDPIAQNLIGGGDNRLNISKLWVNSSGRVIVGTIGQGLFYIPPGARSMYPKEDLYSPFLDVEKTKVRAFLEDRDKNLWIGCDYRGLLMQPRKPMPFSFWNLSACLADGYITALCHDRQGYTWCAVEDNGLFLLDKKGRPEKHIQTPRTVSSLYEDSRGVFWVGVNDCGLYTLDRSTGKLQLHCSINGSHPVKAILEDHKGNLYATVMGEGLLYYDRTTGESRLITVNPAKVNKNLMNWWMTSLLYTSKGVLYVGHYGGVSCFDPRKGDFVPMIRTSLLRQSAVYAMLEGQDGSIWIGTNKGLFRYDPEKDDLQRLTTEEGLLDNIICGLSEDRKGNVWCCTMKGINRIQPDSGRVSSHYAGSGFYSRGVYCVDGEGIVYGASSSGIIRFVPDDTQYARFDRELTVTGLFIDDLPVTMQTLSGGKPVLREGLGEASAFYLSYADNSFSVLFSLMDFRDMKNTCLEYRLREFGEEWSRTLPGDNRIQYHHLAPGDYTLQVRACENGACSSVKSLQIHIAPPWYQTGIARFIYFLLLLAAGCFVYLLLKQKRREEINEAKLQFFINVSHEIRSPMTLVISPLEKLLKGKHDQETMIQLQTIHRNAGRILRLVNQLLDVRKIDKGQMHIRCTETDLVTFVGEWVRTFAEQAEDKSVGLKYNVLLSQSEQLPVWIDRNNFDKVLVNLLANALKYTPKGGEIEVRLTTGTDEKCTGPLHTYAEIAVIDSGKGLDEKEIERIFDRFYQGKANQISTPIGFGIGLNLCRLLVELHHGTITAVNRTEGVGSCFTVRIPLGNSHLSEEECMQSECVPMENQEQLLPVQESEVSRPKTLYKVLVIEDDEELRNFLKKNLSVYYKVETAVDGAEGWKRALTRQPDLIVSDVMMPRMDGFQLLKALKSNGNTNHIPIILLTSRTEFADKIRGLSHGADGYISKPFNLQELEVLISNLITNRIRLKGKYSGAQEPDDKVGSVEVQENSKVLMDRILDVINRHLDDPELNVEMLARELSISRTQLHRKMKELTGMPTSDFIRNIRLRQAAVLLREKDVNITQVAYAVGFVSQPHFSTVFKKLYGLSPKEYADAAKEPSE